MAVDSLILVANPGSSSRKYALYKDKRERLRLHFEYEKFQIKCHIYSTKKTETRICDFTDISQSIEYVDPILRELKLVTDTEIISKIGLRIVAPSEYFLTTRVLDDNAVSILEQLELSAPLHIRASLDELVSIKRVFGDVEVIGVSDSAFHSTKPSYAWNYGIDIDIANELGLKRFGYHGLSVSSVVTNLSFDLPSKMVVCHLGSGASVTAVQNGKSLDNTMGYSPTEGLVMATRAGTMDIGAALTIKNHLGLDDAGLELYLNKQSGLIGLSKQSDDIRYLIEQYEKSDPLAGLALDTYAYSVKKAIGQMVAILDGLDALVFTGTVGCRSPFIRNLIADKLDYFGISIDKKRNNKCIQPLVPNIVSVRTRVNQILVVPTNEEAEIARTTRSFSY